MKSEGERRRNRERRRRKREELDRERAAQHGKPCTYCARPMSFTEPGLYPTQDHVEPRSRGGKITVWACQTCNHVKRDMSEEAWAIYRFEHSEWWIKGRRARYALRWTPRRRIDNLPSIPSETGPEASGIADALTV